MPQTRQELQENQQGCRDRFWWRAAGRARRAGVDDWKSLASEVMAAIEQNFDPAKGGFLPYFNQAVRRRIASALRTQWVRRQHEVSLREDFDLWIAAPSPAVSDDLKEVIQQILHRLPPLERELLLLRFWDDHSCGAVAQATGLTLSAVINRLSRAYAKFRCKLPSWAVPRRRRSRPAPTVVTPQCPPRRQRPIATPVKPPRKKCRDEIPASPALPE